MIKRIMAIDGVIAVAKFRDNGELADSIGLMPDDQLTDLARFAYSFKRLVQSNADQLSMFTQVRGWTPPRGWIVRGQRVSVCGIGNLVCLAENDAKNINQIRAELDELSRQ